MKLKTLHRISVVFAVLCLAVSLLSIGAGAWLWHTGELGEWLDLIVGPPVVLWIIQEVAFKAYQNRVTAEEWNSFKARCHITKP